MSERVRVTRIGLRNGRVARVAREKFGRLGRWRSLHPSRWVPALVRCPAVLGRAARLAIISHIQLRRQRELRARQEFVNRDLLQRAERAHREWLQALNYFEWATTPAEVEHAAFWIKEAERKYVLLWEQARWQQAGARDSGEKWQEGIVTPCTRWYNHAGLSHPAPMQKLEPLVQGEEVKPGAPV